MHDLFTPLISFVLPDTSEINEISQATSISESIHLLLMCSFNLCTENWRENAEKFKKKVQICFIYTLFLLIHQLFLPQQSAMDTDLVNA